MDEPDTTSERAPARYRVAFATGYGMASLAVPLLVTETPQSARNVVTLAVAEVLAVLAALLWSRRAARPDLVAGTFVVAVAGLLFSVTPAGAATAILAALLGAGVGLALGRASPAPRDARTISFAALGFLGALALLAGIEAMWGAWVWVPTVILVGLAGWERRRMEGDGVTPPVRGAGLLRWTALVAAAGLLIWTGANDPQLSWFGPVVHHGPPGTRQVALTFDDGPNGADTLAVARILDEHGAKGTFFMVGKALDSQPDVARRLLADGQLLGGHSYNHDYWRWLDPRYPELDRTVESFRRNLSVCPRFYRPPHGQRTPFVTARLAAAGMTDVTWDVSGADWVTDDARLLADRILSRVRPGSIVLLHDGLDGKPGADRGVVLRALPAILAGLERKGLTPVRLDEMIGGQAYLTDCPRTKGGKG